MRRNPSIDPNDGPVSLEDAGHFPVRSNRRGVSVGVPWEFWGQQCQEGLGARKSDGEMRKGLFQASSPCQQ
jgi:hypothetical protein